MNRPASMNRIFRLVGNESLNACVPAAETTRGRGKRSKRKLVAESLTGGSLVGVVSGDTVSLNQSGVFTSDVVGSDIAVIASDSLSGAQAGNYLIVEPKGLVAAIEPPIGGATFDALNASAQIEANFTYPQLGASPQGVDASPRIQVLAAADDASADERLHKAIAVNVSMKIGANGTLKIENGGLRQPSNLVIGNE